jgi:DNA modification methylase
MTRRLQVITLSRKPLQEGSVAANVLKHGTGALNIDAARIRADGEVIQTHSRSVEASDPEVRQIYGEYRSMETHQTPGQQLGRWPNNLILAHLPGCLCSGTARVKACGVGSKKNASAKERSGNQGPSYGAESRPAGTEMVCYGDEDGMETVVTWSCEQGCPVADLDSQVPATKSSGGRIGNKGGGHIYGGGKGLAGEYVSGDPGFGDTGGVSRYFKQINGANVAENIPQDLIDYLHTMIHPGHVEGSETLIVLDPSTVDWSEYKDGQLHGLIIKSPKGGDPSPYTEEIWRVVKPGAHVLLIADEAEPTGHTGACALEDKGFEIRDAILVAQEAGHLHYVPKAPKKERHAGTGRLARKRKGSPIYDLDEGVGEHMEAVVEALQEAGVDEEALDNMQEEGLPRDLIPKAVRKFFHKRKGGEQAPSGGNCHPTVKPKDVLVRLLSDVPEDATVLDPFMGSGSLGIACLETGHDYIGIEKEAEYLEIADARVRHWDNAHAGWVGAEITSDHKEDETASETVVSLDDLFGF